MNQPKFSLSIGDVHLDRLAVSENFLLYLFIMQQCLQTLPFVFVLDEANELKSRKYHLLSNGALNAT